LWGLPSLPTRTASWPSQPYEQVRPVGLTAFPGGSIRFPDSAAPTARSKAYLTDPQIRVKAPKLLVNNYFRRSDGVSGGGNPSDKTVNSQVRTPLPRRAGRSVPPTVGPDRSPGLPAPPGRPARFETPRACTAGTFRL